MLANLSNTRHKSLIKKMLMLTLISILLISLMPVIAFGAAAPWAPNTSYAVNDLVTYGGSTYSCVQAHTSIVGWEPPNVPALWALQTGSGDTTAPSVPSALTSPTKTSSSVSLSWTASTDNVGVVGYDVYNGAALAGSTTTTSFTVSGLSASTSYSFTVKAKDAAGNVSAASTAAAVTTSAGGTCTDPAWNAATAYNGGARVSYNSKAYTAKWWTQNEQPDTHSGASDVWNYVSTCGGTTDTTAPTAPTSLASSNVTSSSVSLSWTASTDAVGVTGYDIYRGGTTLVGSAATTSFNATGLTAGTAYSFTVKAKDAAGNVSTASSALSVTTSAAVVDTIAPSVPASLTSPSQTSTTVNLAWAASTDNVGVTSYDIYRGGTILAGSSTTASTTVTGLTASTAYTFTVKAKDAAGNVSAASSALSVTTGSNPPPSGNKLLIGYWHNFDNGSTVIRLKDVSPKFDVINVAFAEQSGVPGGVQFTPFNATAAEFKADIAYLNSMGKKVVISLGGQNGYVSLTDAASKQNFISSMENIIDTYGFNGMDIDLESGVSVGTEDADFKHPTSPFMVNLISAVQTLSARYPGFVLSMAPEIAYVQGGLVAYGGPWGAYLPLIYGLRDQLTYIHVQHYNAGSAEALDGHTYAQGTADFQVAMADMLLQGFPIARNTNNMFPALRPDQVVIGLPSNAGAAPSGGFTSNADISKALNYLTKGTSFGGTYVLRNPAGYSGFRGVMTWSINWDKATGSLFSTGVRTILDSLN
jgi:chitinase